MKFTNYLVSTRWILIIGTLIRFLLAPFTGHPYDIVIWQESGELISQGISPYSPYNHLGQTILWALWTGFAFVISSNISGGAPFVYIFLIKLLPIIADILVTYLILNILEKEVGSLPNNKVKSYSMILYFNPVLIIASSFWAMTDSLALLFILLAYRSVRDNHTIISSIFFTIAVGLKLYPIILLPVFFLYLVIVNREILKAFLFGIQTILLFLLIAYLPFLFLPWSSNEITGVLISQTMREFGGMSTMGLLSISIESAFLGGIVLPINSALSSIIILKFIWAISSLVLTLLILFLHFRYHNLFVEFGLSHFLHLVLLYYSLWILTATWVSEQNFVPLLGFTSLLLFYTIEMKLDYEILSNLVAIITTLVTTHIIMNVPFVMFFHIIFPQAIEIYENTQFMQFRATYLVILILASTLTLFYFFSYNWKNFWKDTCKVD